VLVREHVQIPSPLGRQAAGLNPCAGSVWKSQPDTDEVRLTPQIYWAPESGDFQWDFSQKIQAEAEVMGTPVPQSRRVRSKGPESGSLGEDHADSLSSRPKNFLEPLISGIEQKRMVDENRHAGRLGPDMHTLRSSHVQAEGLLHDDRLAGLEASLEDLRMGVRRRGDYHPVTV